MEAQLNRPATLKATPTIKMAYDDANGWLCVTWIGEHTKESVLPATKEIEADLRRDNCRKILNLHSDFILSWQEAPAWAIKSWFPRLFIIGCTTFAWVLSKEFKSGPIITEVFQSRTPFLQALV